MLKIIDEKTQVELALEVAKFYIPYNENSHFLNILKKFLDIVLLNKKLSPTTTQRRRKLKAKQLTISQKTSQNLDTKLSSRNGLYHNHYLRGNQQSNFVFQDILTEENKENQLQNK